MIDTFSEKMMSVQAATNHFSQVSQRKRNSHVVLRWMNRGCGGVVLESVRIGREIYTSREAINRFANRLATAKREKHSQATKKGIASRSRAENDLDGQARKLGV